MPGYSLKGFCAFRLYAPHRARARNPVASVARRRMETALRLQNSMPLRRRLMWTPYVRTPYGARPELRVRCVRQVRAVLVVVGESRLVTVCIPPGTAPAAVIN